MLNPNTIKFFEKVVEIDNEQFIEIRIHDNEKKYAPISKYVKNLKELEEVLNQFFSARWNIYFGINKRPETKRKMENIPFRYLHYFDIESSTTKPLFTDTLYIKQLIYATNVIINLIKKEFNIDYAALLKTGRGLSLYYKFKPIPINYENQFKSWIKYEVYPKIEEEFRKHELLYDQTKNFYKIKAWDSVFDSTRINGCPDTIHTKYPEKPMRIVFKINEELKSYDIIPILEKTKSIIKKSNINSKLFNKNSEVVKHNYETVFEAPEYKILTQFQNLPEGEIKKSIIFPLKMICRDMHGEKYHKLLESELKRFGYLDQYNIPEEEYQYDQKIFRNWCYKNYKWCLENNYKVPYKIGVMKLRMFDYPRKIIFKPNYSLDSIKKIIKFSREFNENFCYVNSKQLYVVDKTSLLYNIRKNVEDIKLYEFIVKNKMIEELIFLR